MKIGALCVASSVCCAAIDFVLQVLSLMLGFGIWTVLLKDCKALLGISDLQFSSASVLSCKDKRL